MFKGVLGAVYLSLIAFSTVFIILVLLSLVMFGFKFLFVKKKEEKKGKISEVVMPKSEQFIPEKEEEDEEIAAVISAVYAYMSSSGSSFRINFVRRISPGSYFWKRSNKLLRRR